MVVNIFPLPVACLCYAFFFFCVLQVILKMSRSRRVLTDLEITNTLEDIFGLPDDPDVSDDGLESDENEVAYSTAKFQRILEKYDEPNDGPRALTPEPSSSPILHAIQPSSVAVVSEKRQKVLHVVNKELRYTNVGVHMPIESPTYKRCNMCSTKEKDKRSKIICEKCGVPLCITPCFTSFHRE